MNHPADPGKMACRHEPMGPVAAFVHVCKHCGAEIDWKPCVACGGRGLNYMIDMKCFVCRGTGIDGWEVAK